MKQIYIIIFLFCTGILSAQVVCTFEESEVDSAGLVSPSPYHETDNPDGGIKKAACINEEYAFKFVIFVPSVAPGFPIPIDSVTLRGEGIVGLPEGLTYETNTDNDVFYPLSADCILISGTPTENNMPGDYELQILVTLHLQGIGSQDFSFPDPAVTGNGKYIINVKEEGECMSANNESVLSNVTVMEVLNNPVSTDLELAVEASSYMQGSVELITMFGQSVVETQQTILPGNNSILIDVRSLSQGIYFVKYRDENTEITKRIHVVKP